MISPDSKTQISEEEVLFDRRAIRTMAKDIKSLRETNFLKEEVVLDVSKDKEDAVSSLKIEREKERIEALIKTLEKVDVPKIPKEDVSIKEALILKAKEEKQEEDVLIKKIKALKTEIVPEKDKKEVEDVLIVSKPFKVDIKLDKGEDVQGDVLIKKIEKELNIKQGLLFEAKKRFKKKVLPKHEVLKISFKEPLLIEEKSKMPKKEKKYAKPEELEKYRDILDELKGLFKEEEKPEPVLEVKKEEPKKQVKKGLTDIDKLIRIEAKMIGTRALKEQVGEKIIPLQESIENGFKQVKGIKEMIRMIRKEERELENEKQEIEVQEKTADLNQKREIEKKRWDLENERDSLEKRRYLREDEFKSVRLQIREMEITKREFKKEYVQFEKQLNNLEHQKKLILLAKEKEALAKKLNDFDDEYEKIKDNLLEVNEAVENVKKEKRITLGKEENIEKEIKILENVNKEEDSVIEKRKFEEDRREWENARRRIEKKRWEIEDKLKEAKREKQYLKRIYIKKKEERQGFLRRLKEIEMQVL